MRKPGKNSLLLFVVLALLACDDLFFPSDPPNTPESNFELLWADYDRYYSFFTLKKLNWDSVYLANRSRINSTTSPQQLFQIMSGMVQYLKDGHADICSRDLGCVYFEFAKQYPANQLGTLANYLTIKRKSKTLSYGMLGSDLGYISIQSFGGSESDFVGIDDILTEFNQKNVKGLVLDVRGNGGGSDTYSSLIASRFTSEDRIYSFVRYKSGPGHSDFGEWISKKIKPDGEAFSKPVMLLTNRRVFSSAEDFVLAMRAIPSVKIVGDTTGGGSGNPLTRVLPNGWTYRVPRWQQVDARMAFFEGVGIAPDIPIWITPQEIENGKDAILERAIEELGN